MPTYTNPFMVHSPDYYTNRAYLNDKAGVQEQGIFTNRCHLGSKLKRKPMDTIADLFDKLSIVNTKIFKLEDVKRNPNATDKAIADATRATNILNQQRSELKQEINEFFGQGAKKEIKSYGTTS